MSDRTRDHRLAVLDALPAEQAGGVLHAVCASPAWVAGLLARRPFGTPQALLAAADEVLAGLAETDVDEALAGHPRIGDRAAAAHSASSAREQSGVAGAADGVLAALAEGNAEYERRFGHVYLVRAAGRSADELLALLRERLGNDPVTERAVLRRELAAINRIRLERWLDEPDPEQAEEAS